VANHDNRLEMTRLYNERPSTAHIVATAAAWIIGIGIVVFGAGSLVVAGIAGPAVTGGGGSAPSATVAPPVVSQQPVAPVESTPTPSPVEAPDPEPTPPPITGVVCIDPGHQARADSSQEPVGPGASETKPKVAGGTRGVATGIPESETVLAISLKLRDELEKRGITVVMVRETQDVNIANSERAAIANNANADLFLRLHCDGANSQSAHGLSTLVPASNRWTGPIVGPSRTAADIVHKAVVAATGAKDNGVVERSDLSGFNWATVPTILVEMGFMTNPAEDERLNDPAYQQRLAEGMAEGTVEYLRSR